MFDPGTHNKKEKPTSPRLKFLFFAPAGEYGGAESLLQILENVDGQFDSIVVCPTPSPLSKRVEQLGIQSWPFEFNKHSLRSRPDWHIRMILRLSRIITTNAIDCVVVNHTGNFALAALSARLTGRPLVRFVRRRLPQRLSWFDEFLLRSCEGIVYISEFVRLDTNSKLKRPRKFGDLVLYNPQPAVEQANFGQGLRERHGLPDDAPIVGIFGRIYRLKGHDTLVRASPSIVSENPNVRFLVVGDFGDEHFKADLLALVERLGVRDRFVFLGYKEEVKPLMALCDLTVLPSRSEALGRVLLESWSVNRPVVGSNLEGIKEIVEFANGGLLFRPESAEHLAEQVNTLLCNAAERERFAHNGFEWVRNHCQPRKYVERFFCFVGPIARAC